MADVFENSSMIRRVHRENAVMLSGGRALMMQAAHPVAFAGFFASTASLDDLWTRLRHTGQAMDTVMFGAREDAEAVTATVRAAHSRVNGTLLEPVGRFPAGTRWAADDPDLLLWILATLADSGALFYRRYVGELSPEELDAYWQDYRVVGALFGLTDEDMPASWVGLEAYVDDMLNGDVLHVTPQARTLARQVVLHPPVHLWFRPVVEVANFAIAGWLPPRLRREYRLWWHPAHTVALSAGAESIRRVVVPLLPTPMRYRPDRPLSPELPFFFRQPAV